jgi:formylglycine-generating enzyme required for sulfatase activity
MEFVNGQSLQDILSEEKRMSPQRALEFICAIGAGVGAAHKQNIVHRDLKPLNIMTQAGMSIAEGVKILDLGLAKIKSGELLGSFVQAKTSGLMGSPFYMAPEQWSDEEPDSRADVYSLGIILYQMLSGDVPFKGSSIPSIMKKHLTLPPPSFKSVGVDVSPRVEAVVFHALEKEVEARTPSVEEFLTELRAAVEADGVTIQSGRETIGGDFGATLFEPSPDTAPPQKLPDVPAGSTAGRISSAVLSPAEQEKLAASRAQHEFEQQERDRVAREELEREATARRNAAQEAERKRKEEEERVNREKAEREERERQQREQIERVERQARELEERLAKLSTSMPPAASTVDPESTQMHQGLRTAQISRHSIPGVAPATSEIAAGVSVPIPTPAPAKSKLPMVIGGLLLALLLLGGGTAAFFMFKPTTNGGNNGNNPTPTPTVGPATVQADMLLIPGGTFEMGRNDGRVQERPAHTVSVEPFYMDRTEVTNEEYAQFVREMGHEAPSHFLRGRPAPLQEKWPVVNVSPLDAEAFAAWRSTRDSVKYRLPTEEEWEYAARSGGQYKLYPWGEQWEDDRAVINQGDPKPVGSVPQGANRWGVVDLIGNVWEWTSSKASLYPGSGLQVPPGTRDWFVTRGASFASDPKDRDISISATYRDWHPPNRRELVFGFRLVRSAQ